VTKIPEEKKQTDLEEAPAIDKYELERIRLQALLDWEMEQDVKDRFQLLSFGLRRKEALIRRTMFLKAVRSIKGRLKKVLSMYITWKAD
jgi:hypothetical protein